MIEIRWHGRGGQGAVTAADLVARAVISEGKYAQAFPFFGPERRGAPVVAFNRLHDEPILIRGDIYEPDIVVVLDSGLLKSINVTEGLKKGGTVIINTPRKKEEIERLFQGFKTHVIDATKIALETLGRPIVNTAMVGAFTKLTGLVGLGSVCEAVRERFPAEIAEKNLRAVKMAYELAG